MKGLKLKCLLVFLVCVAVVQANIPQPPLQTYDKTTTGTIPDLDQNRDYTGDGIPEQMWCAPTASADCVWYYGSGPYPNLIPPGASDPCKADTMITNLGALMGTSDAAGGTTIAGAEAGLQAYYDGQYPGTFTVNVYTAWTFPDPCGAPSASNLWNWMTNNLHDCNDVLPILWLPSEQHPQPPSSENQITWDTNLDSVSAHLVMMTAYDYTQNPDQITVYDPDDDGDGLHAFPLSVPAPVAVTTVVVPVPNPVGPGTTALSTNADGASAPWIVGAIISGPGPLVEDPNVKWSQPPVPVPDMPGYYIGWDEPSLDRWDRMVLDDFLCDSNQPVTKIRWWGSLLGYSDDIVPTSLLPQGFYITFWDDVPDPDPCDPATYSHPGNLLHEIFCYNWTYDFYGWEINPFDPCEIILSKFVFEQELYPEEYWEQEDEQGIYWLGIMALYDPCDPCEPKYPWGWETRPHYFQDDAVRLYANPLVDPPPYDVTLYEPIKDPCEQTWDLSFELLSIPQEVDELDFGDAPDPCYPTLLANNGARHIIGGPWFGDPCIAGDDMPDPEADGQPSVLALGDDGDGNDDEDGVIFPTLLIGVPTGVTVHVSDSAGGGGIVEIWIDYNSDGSWQAAAELVFNGFLPVGTHIIPVTAPPGSTSSPLFGTYARCRISTQGTGSPVGLASDGEVEDHTVTIEEVVDCGDAPSPYPTTGVGGARHTIDGVTFLGAGVDPEATGQPDPCALGDDNDGNDDEDGVVFTTQLINGQLASVDVTASTFCSLDMWIDYWGNGNWSDPSDQVFFSIPLGPGLNTLPFVVPASAAGNIDTFARFRVSTVGGLPPTGLAPDGEVEDYRVHIETKRKWSQPPVLFDPCDPPTYYGWDEVSLYDYGPVVADDWLCEDQRPVSDIHWWGSYVDWPVPEPPQPAPIGFHIGIWTDVPVGDPCNLYPYSHPGIMIWEYFATMAEVNEQWVGFDYHEQHSMDACFKYDLQLPDEAWFWQEGGDTVYWLSISALYAEPPLSTPWGWKTRPHFYNDDAIRIYMPIPPALGGSFWDGEPILEGWDLAFELTTQECFPQGHVNVNGNPDYATWVSVGCPRCWCSAAYQTVPPTAFYGSDYQCKGDTDGLYTGKGGGSVYVNLTDLGVFNNAWQKPVSDPLWISDNTLVCADFDHESSGKGGGTTRVNLGDLNIFNAGWQKPVSDPYFTTNPCFP